MAVAFSMNAAITNSAGNVARINRQYLFFIVVAFIVVVCVGFLVEMSAGRFSLAHGPMMSRHFGNGKQEIQ